MPVFRQYGWVYWRGLGVHLVLLDEGLCNLESRNLSGRLFKDPARCSICRPMLNLTRINTRGRTIFMILGFLLDCLLRMSVTALLSLLESIFEFWIFLPKVTIRAYMGYNSRTVIWCFCHGGGYLPWIQLFPKQAPKPCFDASEAIFSVLE